MNLYFFPKFKVLLSIVALCLCTLVCANANATVNKVYCTLQKPTISCSGNGVVVLAPGDRVVFDITDNSKTSAQYALKGVIPVSIQGAIRPDSYAKVEIGTGEPSEFKVGAITPQPHMLPFHGVRMGRAIDGSLKGFFAVQNHSYSSKYTVLVGYPVNIEIKRGW